MKCHPVLQHYPKLNHRYDMTHLQFFHLGDVMMQLIILFSKGKNIYKSPSFYSFFPHFSFFFFREEPHPICYQESEKGLDIFSREMKRLKMIRYVILQEELYTATTIDIFSHRGSITTALDLRVEFARNSPFNGRWMEGRTTRNWKIFRLNPLKMGEKRKKRRRREKMRGVLLSSAALKM